MTELRESLYVEMRKHKITKAKISGILSTKLMKKINFPKII